MMNKNTCISTHLGVSSIKFASALNGVAYPEYDIKCSQPIRKMHSFDCITSQTSKLTIISVQIVKRISSWTMPSFMTPPPYASLFIDRIARRIFITRNIRISKVHLQKASVIFDHCVLGQVNLAQGCLRCREVRLPTIRQGKASKSDDTSGHCSSK